MQKVFFGISLLGCVILYFFPELDIKFSRLFYVKGFIYAHNWFVVAVFEAIPCFTKIFTFICLSYILFAYNNKKYVDTTPWAIYLVIAALLGPGLVVNTILKDNFGRARPRNIKEFNGAHTFSKVFMVSNQCNKNCSFPSGHAAMGYYFSSVAYVVSRRWECIVFLAAIIFGTIVGFTRILQGGHFLSDVLFSCSVILTINFITFKFFTNYKNGRG